MQGERVPLLHRQQLLLKVFILGSELGDLSILGRGVGRAAFRCGQLFSQLLNLLLGLLQLLVGLGQPGRQTLHLRYIFRWRRLLRGFGWGCLGALAMIPYLGQEVAQMLACIAWQAEHSLFQIGLCRRCCLCTGFLGLNF